MNEQINEQKIMELMDSFTIEQTDALLNKVEITAEPYITRKLTKRTNEKLNGRKKKQFRWLVPVGVCACACAVMFMAFPGTATAIQEFFQKTFSVSSYMNVSKEQRAAIPDVQEIIQQPEEIKNYEIQLGAEMPNWESISSVRAEYNFPAFAQSEFEWIKDIKPEVKEALYDGNNVIITGFLKTDHPEAFYGDYMEVQGENQNICLVGATLKAEQNGEAIELAGGGALQLDPAAYTENKEGLRTANMDYLQSAEGVPFCVQFELENNANISKLPNGLIHATITADINDGNIDPQGRVGMIAQIHFDTVFDASKGNETDRTIGTGQTQTLEGNAVITVAYEGEGRHVYGNMEASLKGMELSVDKVESTQTGMKIDISQTLPETWGKEIVDGYFNGYSPKFGGLKFQLMLDGIEQGIVRPSGGRTEEGNTAVWVLDIPILPTELESIQTMELVPIIEYMSAFNGQPVPLGDKKAFEASADGSWEDTTEYTQLDQYALSITEK